MVFNATALNAVLDQFSIVLTWAVSTFIDLLSTIIDSPLVIPIGIGLAFVFIGAGYRYLKSIGK